MKLVRRGTEELVLQTDARSRGREGVSDDTTDGEQAPGRGVRALRAQEEREADVVTSLVLAESRTSLA